MSAAAAVSLLSSLPSAVLLHAADAFLSDAEANRLACSCTPALRALQRYTAKSEVTLSAVAAFAAPLRSQSRFGLPQAVTLSMRARAIAADEDEEEDDADVKRGAEANRGPLTPEALQAALDLCGPSSVKSLRIGDGGFDGSLIGLRFPASVLTLIIDGGYNRPLIGIAFPPQLTALELGDEFSQPLDGVLLPESLQRIQLGDQFMHSLNGLQLPAGLQSFKFGADWNLLAEDLPLFPAGLKEIVLPACFQESLHDCALPASLQSLIFGDLWNNPIDFALPPSLTHLGFSSGENHSVGDFDQSLRGVRWPDTLTALRLGRRWSHAAAELVLPPSLTAFRFPQHWNTESTFAGLSLPASITSLTLPDVCEGGGAGEETQPSLRDEGFALPAGLTRLDLGGVRCEDFAHFPLPAGLQSLTMHRYNAGAHGPLDDWVSPDTLTELDLSRFESGDGVGLPLVSLRLPRGLRTLKSSSHLSFSGMGGRWPPSLASIDTGVDHALLEGDLPPTLTKLTLRTWMQTVPSLAECLVLPQKLRVIEFGQWLDAPMVGVRWPASLEEIRMSDCWDLEPSAENLTLPASLRVLRFPPEGSFDSNCADWRLPESLEELYLDVDHFSQSLQGMRFPPHLRVLSLGHQFQHTVANLPLPGSLPETLREIQVTLPTEKVLRAWAAVGLPRDCAVVVSRS